MGRQNAKRPQPAVGMQAHARRVAPSKTNRATNAPVRSRKRLAIEARAASVAPTAPKGKLGHLIEAVAAEGGASIDELTARTGWQPHTVRAVISRLRRRGHAIALITTGGHKAYCLDAKADER